MDAPEDLAELVDDVCRDWSLVLGAPYGDASVSYTAAVRMADGTDAVLKVQFPHRECEHEAEALRRWDGDGAVRLLAHDPVRHALLLERCAPGDHLASVAGPDALDVLVGLLPRLWIDAGPPFDTLTDESELWVEHLGDPARFAGIDRDLVDAAVGLLRDLGSSQSSSVLLHQDLHGDNVLAAAREPWLVIDPKPLVGEREFSAAPIVRSIEFGATRDDVRYRLDRLCADLDLDRDRARGWTIGHTVAWMDDSTQPDWCANVVRWLLEP